jgi:hypothetical protein
MNRSALFLSVAALLLVSACSKQQSANTPTQDALPPAEQTAPAPSDSTATPPSDTTATPPADSTTTTTPPADSGTADPGATPPRQ